MKSIICKSCGLIKLSVMEYKRQVRLIEVGWTCPKCKKGAKFLNDLESDFHKSRCLQCKTQLSTNVFMMKN